MRMMFSPRTAGSLVLPLAALATPVAVSADLAPSVGVGIGTSGYAVTVAKPFSDRFNARFVFSSFSYNATTKSSDNSYSGQLSLHSFSLLGDYRPFASSFIVSSGILFPNFTLSANAQPNSDGTFTINGTTFSGINSLGGSIVWNRAAPYFGIGWSPVPERHGLGFVADLGLAFIGSPQVNVFATGSGASNPLVQSNLASERQSIQNSANFKVFPVVSLGFQYRIGARQSDTVMQEPPPPQATPLPNQNQFEN